MRKKIVITMLACALASCIALVGCSSGSSKGSSDGAEGNSQETQQATQAEADTKYPVTIDGCEIGKDYQGNKAAIVTYTWTNNSDKATSFMVAISAKAFQNGVQLDTAIGTGVESQDTMNDLKPGVSQTVQEAYVLDDDSDVTVECSELISFSDDLIAEATFAVA